VGRGRPPHGLGEPGLNRRPDPVLRPLTKQAEFNDLIATLAGRARIAVDTEFHREKTYFPRVALIQVAWEGGLALIDPLELDLAPLAGLVESDLLVVMHAAGQDLEVFDRVCGAVPRHLFDTQLAAGFMGMSSPSLASLHERELGLRLPKGDRLTDWLARPLSRSQLEYAASDVAHLLEIHDRQIRRLTDDGRLAWAEQECRDMLERERGRRVPEDAWQRIKEARQLRGNARDVVRSVADVSPGDPLVTRVAGGTVTSTVDTTSADDPGEAR